MKKYLLLLVSLLGLMLVGFSSCKDKEEAPYGKVSKTQVDFKNEASKLKISVSTNVEGWTAKSADSWCKARAIGGSTLEISVEANTDQKVRETSVSLTFGNIVEKVKVRQLGMEATILVDQTFFNVDPVGGALNFVVTANVDVEIKTPDWIVKSEQKLKAETVETPYTYQIATNKGDVERRGSIEIIEISKDASRPEPKKVLLSVTQRGLGAYTAGSGNDIKGDIKVPVARGTDTSHQDANSDITKSFDGNYETMYHSKWARTPGYFPITLTYYFAKAEEIDYLLYVPRQSGNDNGNFLETDIQISEDGTNFKPFKTQPFNGTKTPQRVDFDKTMTLMAVRFIVKKGAGDDIGFASCSEMEFYRKNPENFNPLTLFADEICSKLKDGVTDEEIQKCPYPFFRNLAFYMKQGKYKTEFRIDKFEAYPHPHIQAATHQTNAYSLLDNPTGIAVQPGENLVVMVGDTHGYEGLSIRVQDLDKPGGDGFYDAVQYPLHRGLNKIKIGKGGLVYVMYHTSTLEEAKKAKPIEIHFASGTVNGYFDSQNPNHEGRFHELLNGATNKFFDVIGRYAHLTFPTQRFLSNTKDGKKLIDLYDTIVKSEQELLGLYKPDTKYQPFQNRMYLHVMYRSYMYATWYHTAYNDTTLEGLTDDTRLMSQCWGPAHEIGHCNQTRPAILWRGMTEVTTNIKSEYIQTSIFKQESRLQKEDMGDYKSRYGKAMTQIMAAKKPHNWFDEQYIAPAGSNEGGGSAPEEEGGNKPKADNYCRARPQQALTPKGGGDVFCKLVPFWQLELYFGKVLGRSPSVTEDKSGFYPDLYEMARGFNHTNLPSPAEQQLKFTVLASKAAKADLTEFFEAWGFFIPLHAHIGDYSNDCMYITQEMIDKTKAEIKSLGYEAPKYKLQYITDLNLSAYRNGSEVVAGGPARISGNQITINNWHHVTVFEVLNAKKEVFFISDGKNKAGSEASFRLPGGWRAGYTINAVSVTGKRTPVPTK